LNTLFKLVSASRNAAIGGDGDHGRDQAVFIAIAPFSFFNNVTSALRWSPASRQPRSAVLLHRQTGCEPPKIADR
jgi:hypothetical protein